MRLGSFSPVGQKNHQKMPPKFLPISVTSLVSQAAKRRPLPTGGSLNVRDGQTISARGSPSLFVSSFVAAAISVVSVGCNTYALRAGPKSKAHHGTPITRVAAFRSIAMLTALAVAVTVRPMFRVL